MAGTGGTPYREPAPGGAATMHVAPATPIPTGWHGAPGARYRVGGPPPRDPYAGMAWTPPPPPPGTYNPIRDIEESEGKRGSEQSITGLERQKTVGENDYATNLGVLEQREKQQGEQHKESLARLAESYAKLGGRQDEAANRLGLVGGGAMISAATKRNANEGVQKAAEEAAFARQAQENENERGRLATQEGQLVGPGGSLVEAIQNARANEQAFGESIGTLKSNEAAAHGYKPPQRPWIHTSRGSFRVGGRY